MHVDATSEKYQHATMESIGKYFAKIISTNWLLNIFDPSRGNAIKIELSPNANLMFVPTKECSDEERDAMKLMHHQ